MGLGLWARPTLRVDLGLELQGFGSFELGAVSEEGIWDT